MTIRERIAEIETVITDLRRDMANERDEVLKELQRELLCKLVTRTQTLHSQEAFCL